MGNLCSVYSREMKAYFTSPVVYLFMCIFLVLMSALFFLVFAFFQSLAPDLRGYFNLLPFVLAIFAPAVTMRLWAEEKNSGTIELLMTFPISSWQAVLGKYLAAFTVLALLTLLTISVPLSVAPLLSSVDWGVITASYIGTLLLGAFYVSVGAWTSALFRNQIAAWVLATAVLLLLAVVGVPQVVAKLNSFVDRLGSVAGWFGTFMHFENFQKGVLNPVDVVYAGALTVFFLILNHVAVEWRKY